MKYIALLLITINTCWLYAQDISTWHYQQLLTIENASTTSPLIDYQLSFVLNTKALIKAEKMRADGADLRIIAADGKTAICHWIENGLGEKETKIWLKIDRIEAKGLQQVYVLYGNPNATGQSNPDCVFNLFEDFSGTTLDTTRWENFGNGDIKVYDGAAHIQAKDANQLIRTQQAFDMPIIAEAYIKEVEGKKIVFALIQDQEPLWSGYTLAWDGVDNEMYFQRTQTEASPCGGFGYIKDLLGTPSEIPIGQWSVAWLTKNQLFAQWPDGSINEGNTLYHFKPLKIAIGINACSVGLNYQGAVAVDWIRIRKLALDPPKTFLQNPKKNQLSGLHTPLNLMG